MNIESTPLHHASPALIGAALAGLLCLASCSDHDTPPDRGPAGGAGSTQQAGEGGSTAGMASVEGGSSDSLPQAGAGGTTAGAGGEASPGGGSASTTPGGAAGQPAAGSPAEGGAGGAPMAPPHITSSQNVGVMTVEQFTALCDGRGGQVEVMPHCGGFATAAGVSYDSTTQLLSEHTCHGANTCAGWNCVTEE